MEPRPSPAFVLLLLLGPIVSEACQPCKARLSWQQSLFLSDIAVIGEVSPIRDGSTPFEGALVPWTTHRTLKGDTALRHLRLRNTASNCQTGFGIPPGRPHLIFASLKEGAWEPSQLCSPFQFEMHADTLAWTPDGPANLAEANLEIEVAQKLRILFASSGWRLGRSRGDDWVLTCSSPNACGSRPAALELPCMADVREETSLGERMILFRSDCGESGRRGR